MARKQAGTDLVIIARTDALQSEGYDSAITRLRAAVAQGADAAFLEGVTSRALAEQACKDLAPTPCLFNNVPGGVSPDFGAKECREMGYKIAIFPLMALDILYPAMRRAVRELVETGNVTSQEEGGRRYSPKELFQVCGLDELVGFDQEAGGLGYRDGA
jgi:2-methylisocitrate lyase-like PEP mutase family enzyme